MNSIDFLSADEQGRGVDPSTIKDLGGVPVDLDIVADLEVLDPSIIKAAEDDAHEKALLSAEKEALRAYYLSYLDQRPPKIKREIVLATALKDYNAGLLTAEQFASIEARDKSIQISDQYKERKTPEGPDWLQVQMNDH